MIKVTSNKQTNEILFLPGPKEDTVADFWRMIWEQKVSTVVMLTNLKERKEVSGYHPAKQVEKRGF